MQVRSQRFPKTLSLAMLLIVLQSASSAAQGIFLANGSLPTSLYEIDLTTNQASHLLDLTSDPLTFALAMCPDSNSLLAIGRSFDTVARVDLSTTPPTESVLGHLPAEFAVAQMACSPDRGIFFTDSPTDTLWKLDLSTCDPTLATTCAPELMGVVESVPGSADINIKGADLAFNGPGQLFVITMGPGGRTDRLLHEIDLSRGLPCPSFSCPATLINNLLTGERTPGITTLSDRRLIVTSRNGHVYEIDPTDASYADLGSLTVEPSMELLEIRSGDLASRWSACAPTLDFETDADGHPLTPGQIIDAQFAGIGITLETNDPAGHPLMIFETSRPTGDDRDLGTPHIDFGGPGIGLGGGADQVGRNGLPRGKVLIISQDANSDDPNDFDGGGLIEILFEPPMPLVTEVHVLDIDTNEIGGTVQAFDTDGLEIVSQPLLPIGNNSFQVVPVGASDVERLAITLPGSGAVSAVVFCTRCGTNFETATTPSKGGGGGMP